LPLELKDILQYEINGGKPILRNHYLNMDTITIFVGDRGSGKSVASVATAILDYALEGLPVWSNMDIKVTFRVDAETAGKYGLAPGLVVVQSLPLDKDRFLDGDDEYRGGCVVVEEINIWLADARRAMSNQNLAASDLVQMIRKLKTALIANCIHEMFVDNRIRDAVDNFVSCEDTALMPEGHMAQKQQGEEFNLKVWPMTRKLNGLRHWEGGIRELTLKGRPWWGSFDTTQRQERIKYQANKASMDVETMIGEAPEVKEYHRKWAGIEERVMNISAQLGRNGHEVKDGLIKINSMELWGLLGITSDDVDKELTAALRAIGVTNTGNRDRKNGGFVWTIPSELGLVTA
jgi:hypothetical protein